MTERDVPQDVRQIAREAYWRFVADEEGSIVRQIIAMAEQAVLADRAARFDGLAEALRPFAKAATVRLCSEWRDDQSINNTDTAFYVTFGDLRRAERILAAHEQGEASCPCTKIEQDETCPVGYPSLLCDQCGGKGVLTNDPNDDPSASSCASQLASGDRQAGLSGVDSGRGWNFDMDAAPRYGKEILLFFPSYKEQQVASYQWNNVSGYWDGIDGYAYDEGEDAPSAWMSLPAAPQQEKGKRDG